MPVQNQMKKIFTPCKDVRIHDCNKIGDHGANPERNSLKQIVFQLFVSDVVERFFRDLRMRDKNFSICSFRMLKIHQFCGFYISSKNFEMSMAFSTVSISGKPKLKMVLLISSLKFSLGKFL